MLYEVITFVRPFDLVQANRFVKSRAEDCLLKRQHLLLTGRGSLGNGELPVITSYSIHYTKLYDPFGNDSKQLIGVQRAGDRRGDLIDGMQVLDLGLQVRLGFFQISAETLELPQLLLVVPDFPLEGGDLPPAAFGNRSRNRGKNPRLDGEIFSGTRGYLPLPRITSYNVCYTKLLRLPAQQDV